MASSSTRRSTRSSTPRKRQCTVKIGGKRCTKDALPNRRTCGGHNAKRSYTPKTKLHTLHLDAPIQPIDLEEFYRTPDPLIASDLFKRRLHDAAPFKPFIRATPDRRLISVNLLPTNRYELANLLADYAMRHSIEALEHLTPTTFDEADDCPEIGWRLIASEYIIPRGARVVGGAVSYYREVVA